MAYEGPQGGDIRATLALSQAEAQAGSSRTVTLPGGRRLTVPVRAGIRNGEEIRLKGQGEPTWVGGPVGDLILTVSIAAPSGQYYSQPGFVNESASPTDYMQAPLSLPTPPTPGYPMPNPTPISNPNYNPVGPYGSSSSPNYPDQVQQQDRPYLSQNHAAYADSPQYMGYPATQQAGQQYP